MSEEKFTAHCNDLGITPAEVAEISPRVEGTKRERCRSFLRVLFTDRPEGLPVNRVLEIAECEGFGKNMCRQLAHECRLRAEYGQLDGKRVSFWKPSADW